MLDLCAQWSGVDNATHISYIGEWIDRQVVQRLGMFDELKQLVSGLGIIFPALPESLNPAIWCFVMRKNECLSRKLATLLGSRNGRIRYLPSSRWSDNPSHMDLSVRHDCKPAASPQLSRCEPESRATSACTLSLVWADERTASVGCRGLTGCPRATSCSTETNAGKCTGRSDICQTEAIKGGAT